MNMYEIIYKKREGQILSSDEIKYFVDGYTRGDIPDYQASALLMAIFLKGMNKEETFSLTDAMKNSGDVVDLSPIKGIKVDKHSTGGVGDKTTLIAGPIAAACGVPVAKMSGRGLGFTGGTVDKLEAIPGFKTSLDSSAFLEQVNRIGISVIGQTAHIAPGDKKLYALRDVTATVENLSLIAGSIMSKKLASGSDAIVLDVKCGKGAFMKDLDSAAALGEIMVEIGSLGGKKTLALVTDMNQPLGKAIGNSLEIIEAIETLKGRGPLDITLLSLELASYMIYVGGLADSPQKAMAQAQNALDSGRALEKLRACIEAQGGQGQVIDDYSLFPQPKYSLDVVLSPKNNLDGGQFNNGDYYVFSIDAEGIGLASQHSGAGRARKEDSIDLSAGILLKKKLGDKVEPGEVLAQVFGNNLEMVENACREAGKAFKVSSQKPEELTLIKKVIGEL